MSLLNTGTNYSSFEEGRVYRVTYLDNKTVLFYCMAVSDEKVSGLDECNFTLTIDRKKIFRAEEIWQPLRNREMFEWIKKDFESREERFEFIK